ncbi:MAG: Spo0E family sporulation regulatory protein-aspartic acid phosphatase [Bacillota bacterium]
MATKKEIERLRRKLERKLDHSKDGNFVVKEIVELSQELDVLIVDYCKGKNKKKAI